MDVVKVKFHGVQISSETGKKVADILDDFLKLFLFVYMYQDLFHNQTP